MTSLNETVSGLPDRVLFVDIETTGLYSSDRLVSIGAVELETASIGTEACRLRLTHLVFDPGRRSHPKSEEVHGYSDWVLRHQEPFADCVDRLWPLFDGAGLIVAHNAEFDRRFLEREFSRAGKPLPDRPYFCTMQAFAERVGGRSGLDAVLQRMGIRRTHAPHGALEDAWLSMQVFFWLKGLPMLPQQALPDVPPQNLRPVPPPPSGKLPRRRRPKVAAEPVLEPDAEVMAKPAPEGAEAAAEPLAEEAPAPEPQVDPRLFEACRAAATLMLWIAQSDGVSDPEIGALSALVGSRMQRMGLEGEDLRADTAAALAAIDPTEAALDAAVRDLVRDADALSDLSRWLRLVTYADGKGSAQERTALDRITLSFEKARSAQAST